jgi:hypothetical protein
LKDCMPMQGRLIWSCLYQSPHCHVTGQMWHRMCCWYCWLPTFEDADCHMTVGTQWQAHSVLCAALSSLHNGWC